MVGESLTWFDAPKPASLEEIAAIETAIGVRLPDDYRDFAFHFSGGAPMETDFEFPDDIIGTFSASVGEFLTLLPDDDRNLLRHMRSTEFFPSKLVPFGIDGGGNYVCFDCRSQAESPVVFWHHGRRGMSDELSFVAKTFSEFLGLLHEPND